MYKKTIKYISCIVLAIVMVSVPFIKYILPIKAEMEITALPQLTGTTNVRFGVLSDVHIKANSTPEPEQARLAQALQTFKMLDPDIDMVAMAGDITDRGRVAQYRKLMEIVNANKIGNKTQMHYIMGNHEYFELRSTPNGIEDSRQRFLDETGMTEPQYRIEVNGYQFIFISPYGNQGEKNYLPYIEFLSDELATSQAANIAAGDPNRPIFVFTHHGMKNTAYGNDQWSMVGNDEFYATLKDYPNVVHMNGHTHYPLNDPRSIDQNDFTSLSTASLSYMEIDEKDKVSNPFPPGYKEFAQGYVVDVEDSRVTVRRLDILNGKIIGDPWVFDGGDVTKYTKKRAAQAAPPSFPNDAVVMVKGVTQTAALIEFTQAIPGANSDIVYYYKITVKDIETDEVKTEYKMWSDFYKGTKAKTMSVNIADLDASKQYTATVTSYEPWGKASTNMISATFMTKPADKREWIMARDFETEIPFIQFQRGTMEYVEGVSPYGKALKLISGTEKNMNLQAFISENTANFPGSEGVVFWIKIPDGGHNYKFWFGIGDNRNGNQEFYMLPKVEKAEKAKLVSESGDVKYTVISGNHVTIPSGFEGWAIIPLDIFEQHLSYAQDNNLLDLDFINQFQLIYNAENQPGPVYFDEVGFVHDISNFITSVGADSGSSDPTTAKPTTTTTAGGNKPDAHDTTGALSTTNTPDTPDTPVTGEAFPITSIFALLCAMVVVTAAFTMRVKCAKH